MVKCPYCGYKAPLEEFRMQKTWKFRFYNVHRLRCPKCKKIFNYYQGTSPSGKESRFTIKINPPAKRKPRKKKRTEKKKH